MFASTQVRERMEASNARKQAKIKELQTFVSRFSANASKARQATSRARQIEKIDLDEMKPSSRISPYLKFEQNKKLHRLAMEITDLSKGFDEGPLFEDLSFMIEAEERIAIIGPNGAGKTTLLRCLAQDLEPDTGRVKWSENIESGYLPQDFGDQFKGKETLMKWMEQWRQPGDEEQAVRSCLGRLLFSKNEINKPVSVVSGGEQGRLMFGKMTMTKPNVILMDEPTNHLDMETIESLNLALEHYPGTLIFVSHDREFVSSLATRILAFTATGLVDFQGNYEDFLRSQELAGVSGAGAASHSHAPG